MTLLKISPEALNGMGITLLILAAINLLWRVGLLSKMVKVISPKPDYQKYESEIDHLKATIDLMREKEKISNSTLDLYRMGENVAGSGAWCWTMSKDPDEVMYTDNFARFFDVVPGQIITAKALMDIVHVDDRETVNTKLKAAFEKGEEYEIQYRIVRRNDRNDLIKCIGKPIKNHNGDVVKIQGVVVLLETDVD